MPLVNKTFSEIITFTRATSATYFDATGTLQTAGNNVARFDYDPSTLAPRGFLVEEQRTNSIRNNTMQGAVAGSPGTVPTNWSMTTTGGSITRTIVGTGTENGITYIDVRYQFSAGATANILFEPNTQVAAASGQTWTIGEYVKLVGGSYTNITTFVDINENDAGGAFLTNTTISYTAGTAGLATQRITSSRTLNNASTAFISINSRVVASGVADITLRIGLPQLELGAFATSVIPTSTVAVTRNADVASVNTLSPWYNASAGTLYAEGTPNSPTTFGSNQIAVSIDDGTVNNRLQLYRVASSGSFASITVASGATSYNPTAVATWAQSAVGKMALAYSSAGQVLVANGTADAGTASFTAPTVTKMTIGARAVSDLYFNGWLRRVIFYPRRLSNAELVTLTT